MQIAHIEWEVVEDTVGGRYASWTVIRPQEGERDR